MTMQHSPLMSPPGIGGMEASLDRLGIVVSLTCGLHCILTPFLIGAAAVMPLGWLESEFTEAVLLSVAVTLGVVSLARGFCLRHRRKRCIAFFFAGVLALAAAKFGVIAEEYEPWTVFAGATAIATAHFVNFRLCKTCVRCVAAEELA